MPLFVNHRFALSLNRARNHLPPGRTLAARLPHREPSAARSSGFWHGPALWAFALDTTCTGDAYAVGVICARSGATAVPLGLGSAVATTAGFGSGNNSFNNPSDCYQDQHNYRETTHPCPHCNGGGFYHIVSAAGQRNECAWQAVSATRDLCLEALIDRRK